jgi:hypothetical protein
MPHRIPLVIRTSEKLLISTQLLKQFIAMMREIEHCEAESDVLILFFYRNISPLISIFFFLRDASNQAVDGMAAAAGLMLNRRETALGEWKQAEKTMLGCFMKLYRYTAKLEARERGRQGGGASPFSTQLQLIGDSPSAAAIISGMISLLQKHFTVISSAIELRERYRTENDAKLIYRLTLSITKINRVQAQLIHQLIRFWSKLPARIRRPQQVSPPARILNPRHRSPEAVPASPRR